MSSGIDIELSFNEALKGFGISPEIAHILWIPFPMGLVLAAALIGVLVTVWLERKISAAAQQRIAEEEIRQLEAQVEALTKAKEAGTAFWLVLFSSFLLQSNWIYQYKRC